MIFQTLSEEYLVENLFCYRLHSEIESNSTEMRKTKLRIGYKDSCGYAVKHEKTQEF